MNSGILSTLLFIGFYVEEKTNNINAILSLFNNIFVEKVSIMCIIGIERYAFQTALNHAAPWIYGMRLHIALGYNNAIKRLLYCTHNFAIRRTGYWRALTTGDLQTVVKIYNSCAVYHRYVIIPPANGTLIAALIDTLNAAGCISNLDAQLYCQDTK